MLAACVSCRKTLHIDPVKCPHCGVLQAYRGVDVRVLRLRVALVAAAGLALGLRGGYALALRPPILAVPPPMRSVPVPEPGFEEGVRARARGLGPYRLVEVEDLFLAPQKLSGLRVAVPGVLREVWVEASAGHARLASSWATSPRVIADIGHLPNEMKKYLVRNQGAFHVFLFKGVLRPGVLSDRTRHWKYHLADVEVESLGLCPDFEGPERSAKILAELAGKP